MLRDFFDWFRSTTPEKKKFATLWILFGILVTVMGVFGVKYVLQAQHPPVAQESESVQHEPEEVHASKSTGFPYEINQVSMAIMNRKGTKTAYAQFSLVITCPNEESHKSMVLNRAKLLDTIFNVGSDFYLEDFEGPKTAESLTAFKKRLPEKYQTEFSSRGPSEIVLKDWIVN
ncbi:hypothetical protein EBR03_03335 [bacterium]|nr:hypothetical protein [bacterium]